MHEVRRRHCRACPFDVGKQWTEYAYNLGCLPGTGEIADLTEANGTAWACHFEPDKVCLGQADRCEKPLQYMEGVHPKDYVGGAG